MHICSVGVYTHCMCVLCAVLTYSVLFAHKVPNVWSTSVCLQTHQLEEEVGSLKSKLAGLRNQCQSLKQELTVAQKVGLTEGGGGSRCCPL